MRGALLRSGKSEAFTALGEAGQPVYRAALQLREAIRRKDPNLAVHLAIPQSDELGNRIDWYSGFSGDVVPWTSATEEERAPARQQLEQLQAALDNLSVRYLGQTDADQQGDKVVFGKLLKRVIYFPDETFVYLVNGKPVLTFWGFQHAGADRDLEPLHCLYPASAALSPVVPLVAPAVEPAVESVPLVVVRRPWWRRWWWLWPLLLLLLLLLLFSLLRGCVPRVSLPEQPSLGAPVTPMQYERNIVRPDHRALEVQGAGGVAAGAGVGRPKTAMEAPAAGLAPAEAPPMLPQSEPAPVAAEPLVESPARSEPPPLPPEPQESLSIPELTDNGPADFLDGEWRAGAGIQDRRTGQPLRLQYSFENGQGEVTVRRPDGVSCAGPVTAAMNNGSLAIDSQGKAVCADGSEYDMPEVVCAQGAQDIADCRGSYGNEHFPMSMRRAGE